MYKKLFLNISCILFLFLISFLSFHGCSSEEPEDNSKKFGIYLLEDQSITWEDMKNKDLSTIKLKEWITGDKIDFYDYSSHVIYLNTDYNTLLNFPHNSSTPFVVVANDKRIYYGCFGPPKDTTQPHVVFTPLKLCTDLVMLEFNPPQRKDIRVNDEIKNALKNSGKIRAGINYEMKNINFLCLTTSEIDSSFIQIYGEITNNESEIIYTSLICAWEIIKVKEILYDQTKLVIYNESSFYSLPGIISPIDSTSTKSRWIIDSERGYLYYSFDKLSKIGYVCSQHKIPEDISEGTYKCYIEYYGLLGTSKENRMAPSGRIWFGYLRSNTMQIEYSSSKGITIKNTNVVLN